jgi:hypothetical protein
VGRAKRAAGKSAPHFASGGWSILAATQRVAGRAGLVGRLARLGAVTLAIAAVAWPAAAQGRPYTPAPLHGPGYTIRPIGPIGSDYVPLAINDRGQIVGDTPGLNGFYVNQAKLRLAYGPPGTARLYLYGIDNRGDIAGYSCLDSNCASGTRAITGRITDRGLLVAGLKSPHGGTPLGGAWAINDQGEIEGWSGSISYTYNWEANGPAIAQGVTWRPHGGTYSAGVGLQRPSSVADAYSGPSYAVDNRGDVAGLGRLRTGKNTWVGLVWPAGRRAVVLPGLPQFPGKPWKSVPNVVNTSANALVSYTTRIAGVTRVSILVVGTCYVSPGESPWGRNEPCLWKVTVVHGRIHVSNAKELNGSGGSACGCGQIWDINSRGWMDGSEGNPGNTPALWVPRRGGYKPYHLAALLPRNSGWTLLGQCAGGAIKAYVGPTGINDKGQIVGAALYHGKPTGFVMTPAAMSQNAYPRSAASEQHGQVRKAGKPCAQK